MKILKYSLVYLAVSCFLLTSSNAIEGRDDNEREDDSFGQDDFDIFLSDFSNRIEGRTDREREERRKRAYIVDSSFELGKSVYYGRKDGVPKLSYCITIEDKKKRLKTKTIKPYKNTSFSRLASNLYNCDAPEKHIKTNLQRDEFLHVLYYLDQRYKLNLKRE